MDRKSRTQKPGALPSLSSPKALGNLCMLKIFVQNFLTFVSASRYISAEKTYSLRIYGVFVVVAITVGALVSR